MAEIAPTRSRTDPPAPEDSRTQRAHIPRRLHANSFRSKAQWGSGNYHQLRHNVKDTVQSAVELKPPINFDQLLRREKKTTEGNAKGSSNTSQAQQAETAQPAGAVEKIVRTRDVAQAKRHNVKREEELRASLKSVEEIGMRSTAQLDDTYYTILEKASILRSTVASLQQLADECKGLHASFKDETTKLEGDTSEDVQGFNNFNQQERNINELVGKLQESRSKTDGLNERLESARLRVEAYEMRDTTKQAKRRTQWRIIWAALLGLLVVIVAILIARDRERVSDVVEQQLQKIGELVEDVAAPVRSRPSPSEDPYLRKLFDGL